VLALTSSDSTTCKGACVVTIKKISNVLRTIGLYYKEGHFMLNFKNESCNDEGGTNILTYKIVSPVGKIVCVYNSVLFTS